MRVYIITFIALSGCLLSVDLAFGRCASGDVTVWPPASTELPPRPIIVVNGVGQEQAMIKHALERIRLVDENAQSVPLKIAMSHLDGYRFSQVVLTPTSDLNIGQQYRLQFRRERVTYTKEGSPSRRQRRKQLSAFSQARQHLNGQLRPVAWVIRDQLTEPTPSWIESPADQVMGLTRLGCGAKMGAGRDGGGMPVASKGSGPLAYRVTLTSERTAHSETAVVLPLRGRIRVGRGMCSGPFSVDLADSYTIQLAPIDVAGRAGELKTVKMSTDTEESRAP